jgi:hypothetical protein
MTRRRKIDDPNLVPRKSEDLPDLDKVTDEYTPTIEKICKDIKKNFYRQVVVPEIDSEIYQTVMMVYYEIWMWYKAGATDKFPPNPGYLYMTSWHKFLAQWVPKDDVYNWEMLSYNTVEVPVDAQYTGNLIIVDPLYKEIAEQGQQIPFPSLRDEKDGLFQAIPDLLDFWFLGFSIVELAVVFNCSPLTIRNKLHEYYDAIEAAGGIKFRPRPFRRKRKKNRMKVKNPQK